MGPAVRHAAAKLEASGSALKVLMIVSDGFPQDPRLRAGSAAEHEYGVQDTAKALREAEALGIETFCVTVDRSGHDYLRRMCPADRYMVIEETAELPDACRRHTDSSHGYDGIPERGINRPVRRTPMGDSA